MDGTQILCDVDGVLADFYNAALEAHGATEDDIPAGVWDIAGPLGLTDAEFWKPIDNYEFWNGLDQYPYAKVLLEMLGKYGTITFATSPSYSKDCYAAKVSWLHREVGATNNMMLGSRKYLMAKPGVILIDDNEKNCQDFEDAGGRAILFPCRWNKGGKLRDPVGHVRGLLDWIVGVRVEEYTPKQEWGMIDPHAETRIVDPNTGGEKGSKPQRFDLIPHQFEWALAEHYGKNCKEHGGKYEARNWEKGYDWGLSYAALRRHLGEWRGGEEYDPETESHHLIAAAWHCAALFIYSTLGLGTDDRRKSADAQKVVQLDGTCPVGAAAGGRAV